MSERIQGAGKILALVLVAVLVVGTVILMRGGGESNVQITSGLIKEQLKYVQDLVGIEYTYTQADTIPKDKIKAFDISIPFTANHAILTYDGIIKYGVDVSQVDVNVSGQTVTLKIPKAKIISHEIPERSIVFLDEGKSIINPVTKVDLINYLDREKTEMEALAGEAGYPAMAERKCGESLVEIVKAMPGMEQYTISIKYS